MCVNCHRSNHLETMCHLQNVYTVEKEVQEQDPEDTQGEHFLLEQ